ncbi:MAG TPA: cell division protein FtsZ [Candidatus Marinimicrobia bacterium]|jgi:cell division protein FtsZ|nr:cell division protein FtsZ [Candidatus Neomarinimicrobiota bacterium]MDP6167918.1 cell division protein FtsZ [Candidatus Neomarinimicrobiota bacterium]MDP6229891.1 cell division protein FtsZ [Candidatus Neomarinimicrobiota bacterium]MDP7095505.1 cell division protein FtsZ [Candidatus Neomarinimicrobiota bacterium]MDP7165938.1 cell division protein FtsZ [Candidatus Neomarinimicrobiota bacterium]|tara:strand:+ start:2267 stop:3472 length:1206 start_codon:yes stop_codon:yes gene_type:complete
MLFEFDSIAEQKAKLKVIGVGGAGGNAVNRMIQAGMQGVDFIVVNTDAQDLENNAAKHKIQIGKNLTKGLGAGAKADVGREAVEADREVITEILGGADMVFITGGMGGGTGTGAAASIAQMARELEILTVGIVTLPFNFEGPKRMNRGLGGLSDLRKACDTVISIPNQKLMSIVDNNTTVVEAFKLADSILHQAAKGISDLINVHGLINLDFADVETIMKNMGEAIMGTGIAGGEERAVLASQQAISSPLLDSASISGAQGVLVNITGGPDLTLMEVDEATSIIFEEAGNEANIIFGAVIDPRMSDEIRVTVIATGFNHKAPKEVEKEDKEVIIRPKQKQARILAEQENVPLFNQKMTNEQEGTQPELTQPTASKFHFDDTNPVIYGNDLDVPAFIRRQQE